MLTDEKSLYTILCFSPSTDSQTRLEVWYQTIGSTFADWKKDFTYHILIFNLFGTFKTKQKQKKSYKYAAIHYYSSKNA